jgi:putative mRNA 3-end processing factor
MTILDDFIAINANGIYCKYGDFYLDPQQPVQTAVISHAHADHAISGNKDVYCTQPTREFMHLRYHRSAAQVFNIAAYHQAFMIKNVKLIFVPAGHMLGSAMILMEYEGQAICIPATIRSSLMPPANLLNGLTPMC